jgi:hypothetical protein
MDETAFTGNARSRHRGDDDDTLRRTVELLREVKQLRAVAARLENDRTRLENNMLNDLERHERERKELKARILELEGANQSHLESYLEAEQQNATLANLCVASQRLHSTLSRADVLTGIEEIIVNLVGSEELAIIEIDESSGRPRLSASFGIPVGTYEDIAQEARDRIAACLATREIWVRGGSTEPHAITACIPLALEGEVRGAIVIFRLLQQKPEVEAADHELFGLLATHAATALYCSSLHAAQARREM